MLMEPRFHFLFLVSLTLGNLLVLPASVFSTDSVGPSSEPPQSRVERPASNGRVYRDRVQPHWSSEGTKFWYSNSLSQGTQEFIVVDAIQATRLPAFDHSAVAAALGQEVVPSKLPVESIEFTSDDKLTLVIRGKKFTWDPKNRTLIESERVATNSNPPNEAISETISRTGAESSIAFDNRMQTAIEVFWLASDGTKQSYGKIESGSVKVQHTFGGHRWQIVDAQGKILGVIPANDTPTQIVVDGKKIGIEEPTRRRNRERESSDSTKRSPDGVWQAFTKDWNVFLSKAGSDETIALSSDGREGNAYGQLQWSPDSKYLTAFRVEAGDKHEVHLIRSSPVGGGRATHESRPYALPGDKFPQYELNYFEIESLQQTKPVVDRFEHEWDRPSLRFNPEGNCVRYPQTDRGHQRFRIIEVNLHVGSVRHIIDESSKSFIWTAHTENQNLQKVRWLESSDEIILLTEKSGWRRLALIEASTGKEKNFITPDGMVVRGIDRIDEKERRIWFHASGCFADQDPYLIHYGYVQLDGSGLVWLTEGDGNHSLQFSPDRRFAIDTYSRVDLAPVTELRRVSDGKRICQLENADLSDLKSERWTPPEVFVAKGRDGTTDIYGIICRPKEFDASKKYPIIEDIYAGPHGSHVPKSFSPSMRYESLTKLGFIVVKIDGMGTANRSKAFHDVCWQQLHDAGFEDRILWIKAAAAKYSEMDITRVGIYGTSAGGQNACAAVLFHPEFYKVAVAACGCHDNRMDKASWNEQWMGYPVGPHYQASSNIENAPLLQGKLLLIVGEMDTNVPPESTLRLADALIRADKDFDLLVVPNAGHGMGGRYGQRRMHDFFVRNLLSADSKP